MRYFSLRVFILLLLTAPAVFAQEPIAADDFSQRGISRFEKNDLEGAIADFTKAIELRGHQLEFCFYFRGVALYRRGRLDEAIADLTRAIELKQHPRFYDDRGNLLAQKGELDKAVDDLNKAIELEPRFAKAYGDRAIVQLLRAEDAAAEADFKRCFELNPALESQFKTAARHLKQKAVVEATHQEPADVAVLKLNWEEKPVQVLNVPATSPIEVTTTPVSQSGLRVLGSVEKGLPGPQSSVPDLANVPPPDRPNSQSRVRGLEQKFTAQIRNTGNKTITNVQWAYFFVPQDPKDAIAYVFTTKTNLTPGKETTLRDQATSLVLPTGQSKAPASHNRAQFKERVVILRLDYTDGTSWHSSGRH
jgi:tetratricopeptide (TPR) repeat protein